MNQTDLPDDPFLLVGHMFARGRQVVEMASVPEVQAELMMSHPQLMTAIEQMSKIIDKSNENTGGEKL